MITRDRIEFESAEEISRFSDDLLRRQIQFCYTYSPYYRQLFSRMKITPDQIQTCQDLGKLPLTQKEDVERNPEQFLTVPIEEIVDLCQTSGTTGRPVSFFQTVSDLFRVGYNEKISFQAAGITNTDRVLIACSMGRCFMAGMAYFEGLRQLGAMAIRVGSGNPSVLAQSVLDHVPSVMICVPSQALQIARMLQQQGKDPAEIGIHTLLCIGEPIRNDAFDFSPLGEHLFRLWKCRILNTYAGTEMATSFTECTHGQGGHFHPELIITEVLDVDGNPSGSGQPGEVVVTPLQVTGMPLIRYRTGDIAAYYKDPCVCGRNSFRLGPILGRMQQKMKVRGTTLYPNAITTILQQIPGIEDYYIQVSGEYALSETIRVVIGVHETSACTEDQVAEKIRGVIRVKPDVVLDSVENVRKRTNPEGKRKAVRFFDCRQKCSSTSGKE